MIQLSTLLALLLLLSALPVQAEIYKCKDSDGKITYQETPCNGGLIGTIKKAPAPSEEEQISARQRLNNMIEKNQEFGMAQEREWQQKQEKIRRIAEQEELARQQQAERARKYLQEQELREREARNQRLLQRQVEAAERSARAAEQAKSNNSNNKSLTCRPNYLGGLTCE